MALVIELPLTDRFTFLVKGLLTDVVGAIPSGLIPVPLIKLLWWRLRRMSARFASIVAQYEAGTLPPPPAPRRPPAPATPPDAPTPPAEPPPAPSPRPLELPRHVGWVTQQIQGAEVWRPQLRATLADPTLPAIVAAAPQLGSLLRSMCRMMAVKKPAWLRLPRRPRVRRRVVKPPPPPPPDWMLNDPTAIIKPNGTVWKRFGASTHWGPGLGDTFEEALKFDRPRQIWPRPD